MDRLLDEMRVSRKLAQWKNHLLVVCTICCDEVHMQTSEWVWKLKLSLSTFTIYYYSLLCFQCFSSFCVNGNDYVFYNEWMLFVICSYSGDDAVVDAVAAAVNVAASLHRATVHGENLMIGGLWLYFATNETIVKRNILSSLLSTSNSDPYIRIVVWIWRSNDASARVNSLKLRVMLESLRFWAVVWW